MTLNTPEFQGSAFTLNNAAVFIPELWTGEIKREIDHQLLLARAVKRVPLVGKKGDIIHIPLLSQLAVNDKLSEHPVEIQSLTEGEFTMFVDKDKETTFGIEDIVEMQAQYPLRSFYTERAGYALARDLDNWILGYRAALVNQSQHLDINGTFTEAGLLTAKEALDRAGAPASPRFLFIPPEVETDLRGIDHFISRDYIDGASRIASAQWIGNLHGAMVMVTRNITENSATGYTNGAQGVAGPTPGTTGSVYWPTQDTGTTLPVAANHYSCLYVHPDWLCLATVLEPRVTASWENLYQMNVVVSRQIYGAKLYRPDHGYVITCDT
jgi:hypothetical protein